MKTFKKLSKTTVNIAVSETEYFSCPMLPIGKMPDFREAMQDALSQDMARRLGARDKMLDLVRSVFPVEHVNRLERFNLLESIELASYLMYGEGDEEPGEGKKKLETTPPAQLKA